MNLSSLQENKEEQQQQKINQRPKLRIEFRNKAFILHVFQRTKNTSWETLCKLYDRSSISQGIWQHNLISQIVWGSLRDYLNKIFKIKKHKQYPIFQIYILVRLDKIFLWMYTPIKPQVKVPKYKQYNSPQSSFS